MIDALMTDALMTDALMTDALMKDGLMKDGLVTGGLAGPGGDGDSIHSPGSPGRQAIGRPDLVAPHDGKPARGATCRTVWHNSQARSGEHAKAQACARRRETQQALADRLLVPPG